MFEDINSHRQAVQEQIQKGFEIGFTGNELEKAHKVGDVHPNGKWVWTQLPSGKYDWRTIKKPKDGSSTGTPAQKQDSKKTVSKEEEIKGFINILKQKPNERHLEQMDVDELKRFAESANKCWLDDENLNRSTRQQCKEWRDLAKQEIASRAKKSAGSEDFETFAANYEKEYRKKHPNETIKNSEIRQQAIKEWDKTHGKSEDKGGSVDISKIWSSENKADVIRYLRNLSYLDHAKKRVEDAKQRKIHKNNRGYKQAIKDVEYFGSTVENLKKKLGSEAFDLDGKSAAVLADVLSSIERHFDEKIKDFDPSKVMLEKFGVQNFPNDNPYYYVRLFYDGKRVGSVTLDASDIDKKTAEDLGFKFKEQNEIEKRF